MGDVFIFNINIYVIDFGDILVKVFNLRVIV